MRGRDLAEAPQDLSRHLLDDCRKQVLLEAFRYPSCRCVLKEYRQEEEELRQNFPWSHQNVLRTPQLGVGTLRVRIFRVLAYRSSGLPHDSHTSL
jgi:hypothetical protein